MVESYGHKTLSLLGTQYPIPDILVPVQNISTLTCNYEPVRRGGYNVLSGYLSSSVWEHQIRFTASAGLYECLRLLMRMLWTSHAEETAYKV